MSSIQISGSVPADFSLSISSCPSPASITTSKIVEFRKYFCQALPQYSVVIGKRYFNHTSVFFQMLYHRRTITIAPLPETLYCIILRGYQFNITNLIVVPLFGSDVTFKSPFSIVALTCILISPIPASFVAPGVNPEPLSFTITSRLPGM